MTSVPCCGSCKAAKLYHDPSRKPILYLWCEPLACVVRGEELCPDYVFGRVPKEQLIYRVKGGLDPFGKAP